MTVAAAQFSYRLQPGKALQMLAAAAFATLGSGYYAWTDHLAGLWLLTLACAAATAFAARTAQHQTRERTLKLNEREAVLPRASASGELLTIPYRNIRKTSTQTAGRQELLLVEAAQGKAKVSSACFATPLDYAEFKQTLQQRIAAARAKPAAASAATPTAATAKPAPAASSAAPGTVGYAVAAAMAASPEERAEGARKLDAFVAQIVDTSDTEPSGRAKVFGVELYHGFLKLMKNDKGVHIESLLCALGSLAGYACQASLRRQALDHGIPALGAERSVFMTVEAGSSKYFFGDPLNKLVAENRYSIWGLAGGAAQQAGAKVLPDVNAIFKRVAGELGHPAFGQLQLPDNHRPGDLPLNYLKAFWPLAHPNIQKNCPEATEWPHVYSIAIQQAILAGAQVLEPSLALSIVMQSAIAMSKVDLPDLAAAL